MSLLCMITHSQSCVDFLAIKSFQGLVVVSIRGVSLLFLVSRTGYQDAIKVGEVSSKGWRVLEITSLLFTDDVLLAPSKVDF